MNQHPAAPRIRLTESTDARNGRLSDPRKPTKANTMTDSHAAELAKQFNTTPAAVRELAQMLHKDPGQLTELLADFQNQRSE